MFLNRIVDKWNVLPDSCMQCTTINNFKTKKIKLQLEQRVFCRKMSGDDDDRAERRVECRQIGTSVLSLSVCLSILSGTYRDCLYYKHNILFNVSGSNCNLIFCFKIIYCSALHATVRQYIPFIHNSV